MSAAVPARPHSEPQTPGAPAAAPQGVPGFPVCTASLSLSGPPGPLISALAAAVPAPQPGAALATRMTTMAGGAQQPKVTNSPRMPAPQTLSTKVPPTFQLPANFQIPPGTVLIRSNNGQLMLVSQQALARAQAQVQSNPNPRVVGTAEPSKNVGNNLLTKVSSHSSIPPGNSVSSTVQRTSVTQSTGPAFGVNVATTRPTAGTTATPGTLVSVGTAMTTGVTVTTPVSATAGTPAAAPAPMTFGMPASSRISSTLGTAVTTQTSVTVGMPTATQTSINGMPSTTQTSLSVMPSSTSVCTPPTTRTPLTVGTSPFTRTHFTAGTPLVTRTLETVATLPVARTPVTGDAPSITSSPLNVATPTSAQMPVMTGAPVTVMPAVTQFSSTSSTILMSTVAGDTPNPTHMPNTNGTPVATGTSSTVGTLTAIGDTDPPSIPATVLRPDSVDSPTMVAVPASLGSAASVGMSNSLVTPAMGGKSSSISTPAMQGVPLSFSTSATAGLPSSIGTFATVGIPTTFGVSTTVRMPLPLCTTAMVRMPVPLGTAATVRVPAPLAASTLVRGPAAHSTTSKVLAPAPLGTTAVVQSTPPLSTPATLAAVRTTASLCTSPAVRVPAPLGTPATIRVPAPLSNSTTIGIPASLGTPGANLTSVTVCATPAAGRPLTVGMPAAIQIPATFGMSAGTRMSFTISTPTSSGTPLTIGLSGAVRNSVPLASSTTVGTAAHSFIPTTVPTAICLPVTVGTPGVTRMPGIVTTATHPGTPVIGSISSANMNPTPGAAPATQKVVSIKTEASNATPSVQTTNSSEILDNVKKCKNFLATLIKLASSGPQAPEMGKNVKILVQQLLEAKIEPEEFTKRLYTELKSSPQPYLVPFLKKSLPALRQLMPNSQDFIKQCGQNQPAAPTTSINQAPFAKTTVVSSAQPVKTVCGTGPVTIKLQQPSSILKQPTTSTSQAVTVKQLIVQQPPGGIVKHVTAIPQTTTQIVQKPAESKVPVNSLIQPRPFPAGSILKQITLPGNKILSLQAPRPQRNNIKENGMTSFREEDDINDVTSMAGVNLNEENACILATNSELVGRLIRSSKEEPFLSVGPLQAKILELGKRHDVLELTSDAVSLISHATQERLRGLVEKLTIAAQHRAATHKGSDKYIQNSDTRSQLKFLEQLDHLEKRRKNEEEREMLLRAAKSRSNKEDPEQLRLKQKAKEMQQMELAQMQQREANLTALAAIGPRRKRPLDFGLSSRFEGSNSSANSSSSTPVGLGKQLLRPRTTRVCLRDLIFCMEQEREMKHSLALYRAHLK
ncbi:transcription initiation factor TFIID subunit 4B isoform X2 [Pleurodeles waltl]|uniref:transcription initiation factor TFIID subunit 4B isoform X2 n=1 Tax=Pleurodeles waltl TaxID=8319 RepID=UPI00370995A1